MRLDRSFFNRGFLIILPGFLVWLMIIVPALTCTLGFLQPHRVLCEFHMPIANHNVFPFVVARSQFRKEQFNQSKTKDGVVSNRTLGLAGSFCLCKDFARFPHAWK